jgi:hypothetical protein
MASGKGELLGGDSELEKALSDIIPSVNTHQYSASNPFAPKAETNAAREKPTSHEQIDFIPAECLSKPFRESESQYLKMPDGTFKRFSVSTSEEKMNVARVKDFPICAPPSPQVNELLRKYPPSDPLGILTPQERGAGKEHVPSTVLRIEPRGGGNLVIYLRKGDFEIVV